MQGLGYPFSPVVTFMYNPNATAISKGEAVMWSNSAVATKVYAMEWPEPDMSGGKLDGLPGQTARTAGVTRNVPCIAQLTAGPNVDCVTGGRQAMGVAMENISATSWGHIALSGLVDVKIGISQVITAGDALITTALGHWIEEEGAPTATSVVAMALEGVQTSAVCSAALCAAFIPPGFGFGDLTMGFNTA
jgi:hypothetical protein